MKQLVQCKICGQAIAKYVCKVCGNNVCEACYEKEKGICISCKQGRF